MSGNNVIQAAGGLLWRCSSKGKELAIIHRPRYGDWTLPKGKVEPGEDCKEAAVREVREETGCSVIVRDLAGSTCYTVHGKPKTVLFWNMLLEGSCRFQVSDEVDQLMWVSREEAISQLDYDQEKDLVNRIWSK